MTCGRALGCALAVLLSLVADPATGAPIAKSAAHVVVVRDEESKPFAAATDGALRGTSSSTVLHVDDAALKSTLAAHVGAHVVALGPRAAARVEALHVENAAAALLRATDHTGTLPVVDLEVSRTTQAAWIARAFPGRTRVLVPTRSTTDDPALVEACARANLTCERVVVEGPKETVYALERALRRDRQQALVWLLPDPGVVAGETVAALVELTIQARAPLVGFSMSFVKAGATAAIRTDFTEMGAAARALAADDVTPGTPSSSVKRRVDPPGARLVVNGRLADKLGITVARGEGVEVER